MWWFWAVSFDFSYISVFVYVCTGECSQWTWTWIWIRIVFPLEDVKPLTYLIANHLRPSLGRFLHPQSPLQSFISWPKRDTGKSKKAYVDRPAGSAAPSSPSLHRSRLRGCISRLKDEDRDRALQDILSPGDPQAPDILDRATMTWRKVPQPRLSET